MVKNKEGKAVIYRGTRQGACEVTVKKETYSPTKIIPLPIGPSLAVCNHSPTGFNWGYGGSGPAQLALALLLDFTGSRDTATRYYQTFKREHVAGWGDSWCLTGDEIQAFLDSCGAGKPECFGD